jgi:hypothetical protein
MSRLALLAIFIFFAGFVPPATAADYECSNGKIKKGASTKYTYQWSGAKLTIKKSGSTKGYAQKSGKGYAVKVKGITKAKIEGGKIKDKGRTWEKVSEAQKTYDCPDEIAATLWVLDKVGAL